MSGFKFLKVLARPLVLAQGQAMKLEWKKTFQMKQDYEALSELARYVDQQLTSLPESEVTRFFGMGRSGVINDPVFSNFKTFLDEGFPETFGECLSKVGDEDFSVFQEYLASRLENKIDLNNLDYLVLTGGGAKGFAYPGVLDALNEMKSDNPERVGSLFENIKETAGASAGALISLPVALGYSPDEIKNIVTENRFENFFDESIASSSGLKGEIVRWAKRLKGSLRKKLAEVDYLDVFTRELNSEIIDYASKMLAVIENGGNEPTKEEASRKRDEVKTYLKTMTHHEMMDFIQALDEDAPVEKWIRNATNVANKKVQGRFFNKYLTKKYPDFGGFNTPEEAMSFSLRRFYGSDKIEEFMGDLIEDALAKVPEKELERVVPSMTTQADKMLLRNVSVVMSLINRLGAPRLADAGYPINQSDGWREAFDQMISQDSANAHGVWAENKGYHWNDLLKSVKEHGIDNQELNTAISAIRELDNHSFMQALNATRVADPDHIKIGQSQIKHMLPKWAFENQRRLYKRNLNFHELAKICDKLPEYGFKKLHITMTRINGDFSLKDMAMNRGKYFSDRYQLAMGSHLDDDYSRMPIKTSARISMNLPVGFEQKVYYGERFIDGGVVSNTPTHVFLNDKYKGKNKTLTCLLGDNSFFENGRNIKSTLKGNSYTWRDAGKMIKNPLKVFLIPPAKLLNWGLYKLNPNYEKINNDDLWRSLLVKTGDVGTIDFSLSKDEKLSLMENAKRETKEFLGNQNDSQMTFINARFNVLKKWFTDNNIKEPERSPYVDRILRPGVFSKGDMGEMHRDMASQRSMEKHLSREKSVLETQSQGMGM